MSATQNNTDTFKAQSVAVSFTVKDLQTSLHWYQDIVGWSIARRIERDGVLRGISLQAGDVRIAINQDDGAKGWERIKGEGFSISITTEQEIDELTARIKSAGGTITFGPSNMPWGVRMIRLTDPDGYKIAISKPLAPAK